MKLLQLLSIWQINALSLSLNYNILNHSNDPYLYSYNKPIIKIKIKIKKNQNPYILITKNGIGNINEISTSKIINKIEII